MSESLPHEDQTWFSSHLRQEMTLRTYGYRGKPMLAFPPQDGSFHDFENFGMVEQCRPFIERGLLRLFSVGSVDAQSWTNHTIPPAERANRHEDYDAYIITEVMPFIRKTCNSAARECLTTGCSMGAYHAANFFFRHPECFDGTIAISGVYDLRTFIGDYMDRHVYFNSPLDYLSQISDRFYLDLYEKSRIIICVGQGAWEDEMLSDTRSLDAILRRMDIPAWVDYWGTDVSHDWPWWRKQLTYFLSEIFDPQHSARAP